MDLRLSTNTRPVLSRSLLPRRMRNDGDLKASLRHRKQSRASAMGGGEQDVLWGERHLLCCA